MAMTSVDSAPAATSISCAACGFTAPPTLARPFRCPNSGDGADHVLRRRIEIKRVPGAQEMFSDREPDPFIRYRRLSHTWHTALGSGMTDGEYVDLVREIERKIAAIDGSGFNVTPLEPQPALAKAIGWDGEILVKNETTNVSGSHKGRHLFGLMLWLKVAERIDPAIADLRLAIASCGNAALAAAVVAAAAGRKLDVFVPTDANPAVVARLRALGATVTACERRAGEAGDPSYLRFREAVAAGALPFTCQGNENGLVIEGCQTLGWEIASQLMATKRRIDRIFVQVGGGALASALIAAFEDLRAMRLVSTLPRIHAVQTASAFPLRRAYERVVARITGRKFDPERIAELGAVEPERADAAMRYAIGHRDEFMWPWERVPSSVAHGILDDETYDWAAVVRGMLLSGGYPIVVNEEQLESANELARSTTAIAVDHTGSSGLAGVLELHDDGLLPAGETIGVLFTGRVRE